MKTKWLFPHRFRLVGWIIFIPSAILGLANMYMDFDITAFANNVLYGVKPEKSMVSLFELFESHGITDEIAAIGVIAGLLLIAFSREKVDDEMIGQLRLEALQWSVYANYIILAIAILTLYDNAFFNVMVYNMFTVLLVFIGRFRWLLYRNSHTLLTL